MKIPTPPPAPKFPHRLEIHGHDRVDDYFWMRDRDSKPVLDFLKAENEYADRVLAPVEKLRETLVREMRSRIKEDDSSVPVFDEGYHYYWRYQTGQEYPLHCRRKGSLDAPEEIFADENEMAKGHSYFALAAAEISPDQNILALATDVQGRRIYDITFKNLVTGKMLDDCNPERHRQHRVGERQPHHLLRAPGSRDAAQLPSLPLRAGLGSTRTDLRGKGRDLLSGARPVGHAPLFIFVEREAGLDRDSLSERRPSGTTHGRSFRRANRSTNTRSKTAAIASTS